jgi:type I restriction enzyme S subunit
LITARGTVGRLVRAVAPISFNQTCYALTPVDGFPRLLLYLSIRDSVDRLVRLTHGTIFATITKQTFDALEVGVPPKRTWLPLASELEPLDRTISLAMSESSMLVTLRDALLPKLLSGELRVRDAEDLVEAAV